MTTDGSAFDPRPILARADVQKLLRARATPQHPVAEWEQWLLADPGERTWADALSSRLQILAAGPLPASAKRDISRIAAGGRESSAA